MKPGIAEKRTLSFRETGDGVEARTQPPLLAAGIVCAILLLAFIGAVFWQSEFTAHGAGMGTAVGMTSLALLFFGFIPVILLRTQRISLQNAGLESRFFLCGLPIWRNFIPLAEIRKFDSTWDEGSGENGCMRLLIRTAKGESKWGIDADGAEITLLAERLNRCFRHFRGQPGAHGVR